MTEGTAGAGSIVARGVIAREPGAPGVVEEFTIDDPGPNEVLVRILASGVCHTDLSASRTASIGTERLPVPAGPRGRGRRRGGWRGVTERARRAIMSSWPGARRVANAVSAGRPAATLRRQPERREAHAHAWTARRSTPCWASAPSARTRWCTAKQAIPYRRSPARGADVADRLRRDDRRRRGALLRRCEAGHQRRRLRLRRRGR